MASPEVQEEAEHFETATANPQHQSTGTTNPQQELEEECGTMTIPATNERTLMEQRFEEFLQQEATNARSCGPPVESIRVEGRGGGGAPPHSEQEDDQTMMSEVTTPSLTIAVDPLRCGRSLYQTPDEVGDPDDVDVTTLFSNNNPTTKRSLPTLKEATENKQPCSSKKSGCMDSPSKRESCEEAEEYKGSQQTKQKSNENFLANHKVTTESEYEINRRSKCGMDDLIKDGRVILSTTTSQETRNNTAGPADQSIPAVLESPNVSLEAFASAPTIAEIHSLPSQEENAATSVPGAYAVAGMLASQSSISTGDHLLDEEESGTSGFDPLALSNHSNSSSASDYNASTTTFDAYLFNEEQEQNFDTITTTQPHDIEQAATVQVDFQRAKPNDNHGSSNSYKKKVGLLLCLSLAVGTLLVVSAVLLTGRNNDDGDTATWETSGSVHQQSYPPFQDKLPAATLKALEAGPHTAESRANEWMWNDPNLASYSLKRQRQRFGLVALFFATQGDQWFQNDRWLDYEFSECEWASKAEEEDLVCDDNDMILTLDLHSNNLNGTLPRDFWFIEPANLDFSHNLLEGQFPTFPANSEFLEAMIMSNNSFTGQLRGEAGLSLKNIRIARMDNNRFQGNSGAIYQLIPKLEVLNYTSNLISGSIATQLQYLTNLQYLGAGDTNLEGTMVTELGLLASLRHMDYKGTHLINGAIPSELGLLTELSVLSLADTTLNGTIPSELAILPSLVELDLSGTDITGRVPEGLCSKQLEGQLHVVLNCTLVQCCT